jgi:MOSC domain-containing protein YiiM
VLGRDELARLFDGKPRAPRDRGTVDLLVVRTAPGEHLTPPRARLDRDEGLVGDRWASASERDVDRQLTLMMTTVAELVCDGQPLHLPGDNLLVNLDLSSESLGVGARLRAGAAILEISPKPHTGCKKFVARFGLDAMQWVNDESGRARRLRGVNCRIVAPGDVYVGDAIEVISR